MNKTIWTLAAAALAGSAHADCWVASNFNGATVRQYNGYKLNQDGLSAEKGKPLVVVLKTSGNAADVTGWDAGSCQALSPTEIQCRGASNMELWKVDGAAKKAFYVQYRRGSGVLDGGGVFVGELIGQCEQK